MIFHSFTYFFLAPTTACINQLVINKHGQGFEFGEGRVGIFGFGHLLGRFFGFAIKTSVFRPFSVKLLSVSGFWFFRFVASGFRFFFLAIKNKAVFQIFGDRCAVLVFPI